MVKMCILNWLSLHLIRSKLLKTIGGSLRIVLRPRHNIKNSPFVMERRVFCLRKLITQSQIVGNHGNELRIGGLAAAVLDGVAEIGVERVDVAAIPRDLDGVADGSLHTAGGGAEFLGDGGIEDLRDRIDDVIIVDRHDNGEAKILIALDVRGYADLMNDLGDL